MPSNNQTPRQMIDDRRAASSNYEQLQDLHRARRAAFDEEMWQWLNAALARGTTTRTTSTRDSWGQELHRASRVDSRRTISSVAQQMALNLARVSRGNAEYVHAHDAVNDVYLVGVRMSEHMDIVRDADITVVAEMKLPDGDRVLVATSNSRNGVIFFAAREKAPNRWWEG